MERNDSIKIYKHVITIDFISTKNAKIVMDSIKPDFFPENNQKNQTKKELKIIDSKLIITIECNDVKVLRKTVNSIYGMLILATKTIEIFD